jgi:hypothetical protein
MRIFFVVIIAFYSILVYAQENDSVNSILINAQKDYLYHLQQLNIGTILSFKETTASDKKKPLLITEKLNIDLQIKNVVNMPFDIQEKCDSASIQVNVFFVLLKNTDGFIKKTGDGEFFPNKVTLTYKWVLIDDLLIFIFTSRELWHKFQQYVYLPNAK